MKVFVLMVPRPLVAEDGWGVIGAVPQDLLVVWSEPAPQRAPSGDDLDFTDPDKSGFVGH
jgi:hypothetical protein